MALMQTEISEAYQKQSTILAQRLQTNHQAAMIQEAKKWAAIPGVRVNYSFFQNKAKTAFSREEVVKALLDLGVDIKNVKGKKWYQFSKSKWDTKLLNAIKQINY